MRIVQRSSFTRLGIESQPLRRFVQGVDSSVRTICLPWHCERMASPKRPEKVCLVLNENLEYENCIKRDRFMHRYEPSSRPNKQATYGPTYNQLYILICYGVSNMLHQTPINCALVPPPPPPVEIRRTCDSLRRENLKPIIIGAAPALAASVLGDPHNPACPVHFRRETAREGHRRIYRLADFCSPSGHFAAFMHVRLPS